MEKAVGHLRQTQGTTLDGACICSARLKKGSQWRFSRFYDDLISNLRLLFNPDQQFIGVSNIFNRKLNQ